MITLINQIPNFILIPILICCSFIIIFNLIKYKNTISKMTVIIVILIVISSVLFITYKILQYFNIYRSLLLFDLLMPITLFTALILLNIEAYNKKIKYNINHKKIYFAFITLIGFCLIFLGIVFIFK